MKKIFSIALLAILFSIELFAGSLDYLKNGEYAYFVDRLREQTVYYKGIAFVSSSKAKSQKVFLVRYVNLKSGKDQSFYMYINDAKKELEPLAVVDLKDKPLNDKESKEVATDFLYMLQFAVDNQKKIKKMVNLVYNAPNLPARMQLGASCAPYFAMFRIGALAKNGGEVVFEIDRMGVLKTEADVKAFATYDVRKGNGVIERRGNKPLIISKAKTRNKKLNGCKFTIDKNWESVKLPALGASYRLPFNGVEQNSIIAVERMKLSKLPKEIRSAENFLEGVLLTDKTAIASSAELYDWRGFKRLDYYTIDPHKIKNQVTILAKVVKKELVVFDLFSFADIRADNEKYYDKILKSVKF